MNPFEAVRNYLSRVTYGLNQPGTTGVLNHIVGRVLGSEPLPISGGWNNPVQNPSQPQIPIAQASSPEPSPVFIPQPTPDQWGLKGHTGLRNYRVSGANTPTGDGFRLSVPGDNGQTFNFPPEIAQQIGNVFEPIHEATSAARVLRHPNQQTRTAPELKRLGENWNRGENPDLITNNIDIPNPSDNSIDRGLFRINSNTFNGMIKDPFWKKAMATRGITKWSDMEDPNKNTQMAYLILARSNWDTNTSSVKQNPNWGSWYAAPIDLRTK